MSLRSLSRVRLLGGLPAAGTVDPANQVIWNQYSDLPVPSGGIHQLADDKIYILGNDISTPNKLACGVNNGIFGGTVYGPTLTYTGSETMFTGVDKNFQIENISLNAPSAQIYNFSSTPSGGGNTFFSRGVIITSCDKFGTFTDMADVDIAVGTTFSLNDGLTAAGTTNWSIFSLDKLALISTNAAFIGVDLETSLHQTLEFSDLILRAPAGAIGIKGLADSANLTSGNLATVVKGEFSGGLTPLSGIAIDDIRWDFQANACISDSVSDALASFNGNTTETSIANVNEPTKVNAVWTCVRESRFTCSTNGRATFNAERDDFFPADVSAGIISVGGTPINATVYLAKNGTAIDATGIPVAISGATPRTLTIPWQVTMSKDDYLEVFVENNTNDNNIIVENAILRIR